MAGLIYLLEKNLVTCILMFDIGRMPIHAEQKDKEQRHFSFFNKSALPFWGTLKEDWFGSPPEWGVGGRV